MLNGSFVLVRYENEQSYHNVENENIYCQDLVDTLKRVPAAF